MPPDEQRDRIEPHAHRRVGKTHRTADASESELPLAHLQCGRQQAAFVGLEFRQAGQGQPHDSGQEQDARKHGRLGPRTISALACRIARE